MPSFIAHLRHCRSDGDREAVRDHVQAKLDGTGINAKVGVKSVNVEGQLRIECADAEVTIEQIQNATHHVCVQLVEREDDYEQRTDGIEIQAVMDCPPGEE